MDINEISASLFAPAVQVALIMGVAEIVKRLGLDSKFIPLVDLGLGLLLGVGVYTLYQGMHPVEGIVIGIALGLSACGLFSGVKNLTES